MGFAISIDGINVTQYVNWPEVSVTDGADARGDTLEFPMMLIKSAIDGGLESPKCGMIVRLVIDGTALFEGAITSVTRTPFSSNITKLTISCDDYTFMLDKILVAIQERPEELAGTRIKYLLETYCSNFADYSGWSSKISNGLTIPAEGYDYDSLSSIFDRICEATGYVWYVEFNETISGRPKLVFDSGDADGNKSPLNASYSNTLNIDTNLEIGGVVVTESISDIANVVIVKDYSQKSDNQLEWQSVADGTQNFFSLPMEPFSVDDEDVTVKISSDGGSTWTERSVALDPLDGSEESLAGEEGKAYLCVLNWGVRIPEVDPIPEGSIISVEYNYNIPDRVGVFIDIDSINEMARRDGTNGEYHLMMSLSEFRIDSPSDNGFDPIEFYAQMVLDERAWPEISGDFTVLEPSPITGMSGWRSGQMFKIWSEDRDIFDIKKWVKGGWDDNDKVAAKVYVTGVTRSFVSIDESTTDILSQTKISFSTRLRR